MKKLISMGVLTALISVAPAHATWQGVMDHIAHNKLVVAFGAACAAGTLALKYASSYYAHKADNLKEKSIAQCKDNCMTPVATETLLESHAARTTSQRFSLAYGLLGAYTGLIALAGALEVYRYASFTTNHYRVPFMPMIITGSREVVDLDIVLGGRIA